MGTGKRDEDGKLIPFNVKKGDRIITSGGIHGQVTAVEDTTLTVEISDKVRVKLNRANIAGLVQAQTQPAKKAVEPEKSK